MMNDLERIRAEHTPTHISLKPRLCESDGQDWPCDTAKVLKALDESQKDRVALGEIQCVLEAQDINIKRVGAERDRCHAAGARMEETVKPRQTELLEDAVLRTVRERDKLLETALEKGARLVDAREERDKLRGLLQQILDTEPQLWLRAEIEQALAENPAAKEG